MFPSVFALPVFPFAPFPDPETLKIKISLLEPFMKKLNISFYILPELRKSPSKRSPAN